MTVRMGAAVCILAAVVMLHDDAAAGDRPNPAGDICPNLERGLDARLSLLDFSADPLGEFREIGASALEDVKTCPQSARLWYLAARSAEVLRAPFGDEAFAPYGGARTIAADAARRAPRSVQIATVVARLDGSLASARTAYDLDHTYAPARNAFALALSRAGRVSDSLALLQGRMAVEDHLSRARILLEARKPEAAAAEARIALAAPSAPPEEPTPSRDTYRDGNEILGFALLAAGHAARALAPLRIAAGAGSIAARSKLAAPR